MVLQADARSPADVHGAERLARTRESAVLALAATAPVLLVVGVLVAQGLQPEGAYDPIGQTVSTLAGRGATQRWFITGVLAGLGVVYVLVAAGLRGFSSLGRGVLGFGGAAVVVTALAPQPAQGSSAVHMTAMVAGCVAFVLWPLALAADPALAPRLRRDSLVATLAMLVALGWLCAQAWTDGTWLGVAERALLLVQTVWPIRIAALSRRAGPQHSPAADRATLALAVLAPIVLVVGLLAAQAAQPVPDPLTWSLSALAGRGAVDRWIMAGALAVVGLIYLLVPVGLRRVPLAARLLLGLGGAMLLVAALSPQPVGGYSTVHMVAGALAWLAFATWPLALACSPSVDLRLRRSSVVVFAVLAALTAWFAVELVTDGTWYGTSQRIVLAAHCVWPVVVAARVRSSAG